MEAVDPAVIGRGIEEPVDLRLQHPNWSASSGIGASAASISAWLMAITSSGVLPR